MSSLFSFPNHSPSHPNIPISSSSYTRSSSSSHLKLASSSNLLLQDLSFHLIEQQIDTIDEKDDPSVQDLANNRRRRRRTRRALKKIQEHNETCESEFDDTKEWKSKLISSKEEARLSWHLKERARIEGVRSKLIGEMGENETLSSSKWAEAAGISLRNLDKIQCKGRESEKKITICYQRLIVSVASSHQGKGLSIQDLIQEGNIGLLHGALKFKPEKGYKLSTYAYWWIRQYITRAIAKKSKIIRMPGTVNEIMPRICEAINVLNRKLQRFPTYNEIAEATNISSTSVKLAMDSIRPPISIDRAMTSRGYMSLQEIIPGPEEMKPETRVRKSLLKHEVHKLLKSLCEREAQILKLHFGLHGGTPCSFEEIGRTLKLSRERARQLSSDALVKLLEMKEAQDLKYLL